MEVFLSQKLTELYENGRTKSYPIQSKIYEKFIARIEALEAHPNVAALRRHPFHFKEYGEHFSMRLDEKYRLEMRVEWLDDERTVGKFYIFELSNHYGD